ncbi:MAG: TnsA endonuclease N-terminal domain-containing protein [Pseudomonadota bacterium]
MPVRKIPKNYLVVTGRFASAKNDESHEFESLLERDHLILLEFDNEVASFEVQPVRIPVPGVPQGYVPDARVVFKNAKRPAEIVEVKPKADLERYAKEFEPKFSAAERYCTERGQLFVIKSEDEIRGPYLQNLKFLRRYKQRTPPPEQKAAVLQFIVAQGGKSSSDSIVDGLGGPDRAAWLSTVWTMLVQGDLSADLESDFPVDVPVWIEAMQ